MPYRFLVRRASSVSRLPDHPPCDEARWLPCDAPHFESEGWQIEFADLDSLMAFFRKYGSIVIENSVVDGALPNLIIYDEFIE